MKFQKANFNILIEIDEIGPIVANSIVSFWSNNINKIIINNCLNNGVKLENVELNFSEEFSGKTFVFTGSLKSIKRKTAREHIEKRGARISNSISKNTDYLILGASPGSKLKKAKELQIPILNEKSFLKIIDNI